MGRVLYDGWRLRVEQRLPAGEYRLLGRYESCSRTQLKRKLREIDAIFDAWRDCTGSNGETVKASWRRSPLVPGFRAPANCIIIGCAVVESDGIPIAHVYKTKDRSAVWKTFLKLRAIGMVAIP